jgi:hypothetical protein
VVQLNQRDADVLAYLAEVGQAPLDVVAKRFFAADPRTGKANKDPMHAATRRVAALRAAGYIDQVNMSASSRKEPAGSILMLDRAGASLLGVTPKKVHAKHRHHHFQTLRLVEEVRAELMARGQKVLRVVLEDELRAEILSRREKAYLSREMKRGDGVNLNDERYAMPDAVVVVDDGAGGEAFVAVEYLSATYRDDDLKAKRELLSSSRWRSSVVQADNHRTAARARAVGLESGVIGKTALG